jgi:hypothetical protein
MARVGARLIVGLDNLYSKDLGAKKCPTKLHPRVQNDANILGPLQYCLVIYKMISRT